MSRRRQPDKEIAQHTYWPLPGSIWIRCLKRPRPGGRIIQISMITTPTQWWLAVYFGCRTYPTGGINMRKRNQSMSILPMLRAMYSLSYHMLSDWRPVSPLAGILSAGGSHKLQARPLVTWSFKAVRSSQYKDLGRRWPWLWYKAHRKLLGNEERGGGKELAQND